MADIKLDDFSVKVKNAIESACRTALEEAGGELEAQVKRNQTRVDTGQTKNAWTHKVDGDGMSVVVGNPLQNAIWEEFGTGEYALEGGRKGGWTYRDAKGEYHHTYGKKPLRPLHKAFTSNKTKVVTMIEKRLKDLS